MRGSANLFCTTDNSKSSRGFENSYFKKFRQDNSQDALGNDNQSFIPVLEKSEGKQNGNSEGQNQFLEGFSKKDKNEFSGGFARGVDLLNHGIHVRYDDLSKNSFESHFPENSKGCPIQTMARQQYKNYNLKNDFTKASKDSLSKAKNLSNSQDCQVGRNSLNDLPEAKLQKKPKEKLDPKLEAMLELVERQEMNAISLLNEMSGKLKQKVEYTLTEGLSGRTKIFECVCLFGTQIIGTRKGNTKQNAKSEAAKQGLRTLLTEKQFLTESAALILSIQKAHENMTKQKILERNNISPFLVSKNSEEQGGGPQKDLVDSEWNISEALSTSQSISSINQEYLSIKSVQKLNKNRKNGDPMKSSLYELNVLARRLAIEPVWFFPFEPNSEGYFEVSLQFGSLVVTKLAKRKQDAKKEAAAIMIKRIKEAQQNEEKSLQLKTESVFLPKRVEEKNVDRAKTVFEKAMKAKMLQRMANHRQFQDIQKEISEEQAKKISILDRYQLKSDLNQNLEDFFHKIENYTSMITSNPKQIMLDEENHLADYVKSCYLTPVGSFALGCLRTDKLVIDAILSYEEVKSMKEEELLELYKHSLQTCYDLDQESGTNIEHMKFSFNIEDNVLQIKSMGNNCLTLNIFVVNGRNLPIQHIHNIYSHLNGSLEELRFLRKPLRAIRIWREKCGLTLINIEILDIILLAAFLMVQSTNLEKIFAQWSLILNSTSLTLKILKHFNRQYFDLYEKFSSKLLNVSKMIFADDV